PAMLPLIIHSRRPCTSAATRAFMAPRCGAGQNQRKRPGTSRLAVSNRRPCGRGLRKGVRARPTRSRVRSLRRKNAGSVQENNWAKGGRNFVGAGRGLGHGRCSARTCQRNGNSRGNGGGGTLA